MVARGPVDPNVRGTGEPLSGLSDSRGPVTPSFLLTHPLVGFDPVSNFTMLKEEGQKDLRTLY